MAVHTRQFAAIVSIGGLTLVLCAQSLAQEPTFPHRSRDGHALTGPPMQGVAAGVATPAATTPQAGMAAAAAPINLLQEPAKAAQVSFANDRLAIHADNASLAAILREVAAQSGMKVTGLGSDERVFGTFGPAAPSDVLDDLLHGTSYDVMLVGNASYGAPRELILTPARNSGAQTQAMVRAAPTQAAPEDTANDQESQDTPPPDAAPQPPPAGNQGPAGVRTPQQLFQQLQQMRQAQQQQVPQQEPPQTQTAPSQP